MAKPQLDIDALAAKVLLGERAALSRAITLSESHLSLHQEQSLALLNKLYSATGKSIRIGISGIPGAGKSTFIEAFGTYLIEVLGKRVAVLAVDPSSAQTGGSILGDKTRMEQLSRKAEAFIRPSPTNTELGGVGQYTQKAILLCEAAGYDVILVETVGVGQSEQAVNGMVDVFLLLQIVGAGDDIQAIKRGVLECVDMVVMNKADGGREKTAKTEAGNLQKGLALFTPKHSGWTTPVLTCSALENKGIDRIWETIAALFEHLKQSNKFEEQRDAQLLAWLTALEQQSLSRFFEEHPEIRTLRTENHKSLKQHQQSPFEVVQKMNAGLAKLFPKKD